MKPGAKDDIRDLGLMSIKDFFELTPKQIEAFDPKQLKMMADKAKLAMSFEREMGISERSSERNTMRVLTMVAADKKEPKSLIKKALPQYAPS